MNIEIKPVNGQTETDKQLQEVQKQIQEADTQLERTESLIEKAANDLIKQKMEENKLSPGRESVEFDQYDFLKNSLSPPN